MQVAIHLGAHCTDDDALLRTLLQNRETLAHDGICVPGPGRYRKIVLREAQRLRGIPADTDFRDLLIEQIIDDNSAQRIIMSYADFLSLPARVFENGLLYDQAGIRPTCLRNLFPDYSVEFFLAIRNPATFIPAVFAQTFLSPANFSSFLDGVDLEQIRWSDVLASIRDSNSDCKFTVWCNEDTPLIWPQIIQEITGHNPQRALQGGNNILAQIMRNEGLERMDNYLACHPPRNEAQRRRVLLAFLDKYAIKEAVEEELDVPGWTTDLVQDLTENYESDLHVIETMAGINFITP